MRDGGRAPAQTCARTVKRAMAVATTVVVCLAPAASADPRHVAARPPIAAPIVYGSFDDSLAIKPASDTGPAGAINLRPGAVNASFAPTLSSTASRAAAIPAPLTLKSTPSAQPYAGAPYKVAGKWYVPAYEPNYDEVGIASWYGPTFHGKPSASGEPFDEMAMTAAHPTLPIPSMVRVTNLENGKTALVRLNDRGPFVDDRIIDLSNHAGEVLGLHAKGTAKVRVQYVGPVFAEAHTPGVDPGVKRPVEVLRVSQPVELIGSSAATFSPTMMPSVELSPATLPSPTLDTRPIAPVKSQAQVQVGTEMAAKPASSPIASQGFYLQAGAFAAPANAEALRTKLASFGPAAVTETMAIGRTLNRVIVGPWASRAEAEAVQLRMTQAGAPSILVAHAN